MGFNIKSTRIKKLSLTHGEVYAGDVVKDFKDSRSFTFMFELPK